MIRRDLFETALWHPLNHFGDTTGGLGPPLILAKGGSVTAKIDRIVAYLKFLDENITEWNKKAGFVVYYRDVTGGKDTRIFHDLEVRKRLFNFLGVEDMTTSVSWKVSRKPERPPNEECVTNWKELLEEVDKNNIKRHWDDEKVGN